MRMPFGKYKGHALDVLPDAYLLWVIANIPLREPLWRALTEEMALRGYDALPPPPSPSQRLLTKSRETAEGGRGPGAAIRKRLSRGIFPCRLANVARPKRSSHEHGTRMKRPGCIVIITICYYFSLSENP